MQCIMYVTNYVREGKHADHLTTTTSPMLFDVMYCETIFGHLDSKKWSRFSRRPVKEKIKKSILSRRSENVFS